MALCRREATTKTRAGTHERAWWAAAGQKTATHIFNYLNKGAPAGGLALAFDPRYGIEDLYNPGTRGQFSVKFIFWAESTVNS